MFFVGDASDKQISKDRGLHNDCLIDNIAVVKAAAVGGAKIGISEAFCGKIN
jgi:hypothetical protein